MSFIKFAPLLFIAFLGLAIVAEYLVKSYKRRSFQFRTAKNAAIFAVVSRVKALKMVLASVRDFKIEVKLTADSRSHQIELAPRASRDVIKEFKHSKGNAEQAAIQQ